MKEDFFLIGYSNMVKNKKSKLNWTSKCVKKIISHKIIFSMILIIMLCFSINFLLIFRFIHILQAYYISF